MTKKRLIFFVLPVIVIVTVALGFYFGRNLLAELERTGSDYCRDAVSAITKSWSPQELLSRASLDLHKSLNIQQVSRDFSVLREELGPLKTITDVEGKVEMKVGIDGVKAKGEKRVKALYEKGSAVIDMTISHIDKRWQIDRFNVVSKKVSTAKSGEDLKSSLVQKEEKPSMTKKSEGQMEKEKKDLEFENFSYTSKGRRDPFFATVLSQRKRAAKEKLDKGGYELEELRIVGVLKTDRERFAMMEDRQGNGVLFRKGDYINKNLWIMDITDDKIVYGYRLKNEVRTIVMDLPEKR